MAGKLLQDALTIDPVAMNITSRVSAGCRLQGDLVFEGGLLVEGELHGQIRVNGRLIVWTGGRVTGRIKVMGDTYLIGHLGSDGGGPADSQLECQGMACVSRSGVSTGTLMARRLQVYEGAQLKGPFRTLVAGDQLPVLRDAIDPDR